MTKRWGATTFVVAIAVSLLVAGCSDHALGRLGRTSDWLEQVKPTSVTSVATTLPPLIDTELVGWWNLQLGGSVTEDPETVVARVYQRGDRSTRFVQASPFEVAAALPGVRFPSMLPGDVESVTSQLVYAPGSPTLSAEEPAVFGLWSTEPYSRSRSVGQRGVLGIHPVGEEPSCARLSDGETVGCEADFVGDIAVWRLTDSRGTTWVWIEGDYRYELFLRGDDSIAPDMIGSTVPLARLLRNTVTASG